MKILDKLFNVINQTTKEVNDNVVNVTKNISENLLLDALPNDPPMYYEGSSLAFSAYKMTPMKFKSLLIKDANTGIYGSTE
jgi:hypothetical protein